MVDSQSGATKVATLLRSRTMEGGQRARGGRGEPWISFLPVNPLGSNGALNQTQACDSGAYSAARSFGRGTPAPPKRIARSSFVGNSDGNFDGFIDAVFFYGISFQDEIYGSITTTTKSTMTKFINHLLILTGLLFGVLTLDAQTTAFTYRGQLKDTNGPVTGNYDLRFALYDAGTNGTQIGSPLTNAPVGVTNGLFTALLDFGSSIFTGADRWLEIGVRTNGSGGGYTTMSQRQQLTPTPYAIYSAKAGTAATANSVALSSVTTTGIADGAITGAKIAPGQVVKSLNGLRDAITLSAGTNITLTASGNNIQIASTSSGGGSGLSWQVVTSSNQQAQQNTGYIAANDSAVVTITLPPTPNVGDVIRVAGTGLGGWAIGLASGQTILGASSNALQTTTPAGVTWTPTGPSANWSSVASSSNGTKLVAIGTNALVYTSTNSGATWVQQSFHVDPIIASSNWAAVASSADGVKLVAAINGGTNFGIGEIATSSDSGATWSIHDPLTYWRCVASSSDGVKLVGGGQRFGPGSVYTSTNSGVDWTGPNGISGSAITSVASSSDGVKLAAGGTWLYTSADSGANWTDGRNINFSHPQAIACSADGSKLVAVVNGGQIYTSSDSGATWEPRAFVNTWQTVASSADGLKLVAAAFGGQIYTSTNAGASWTAQDSNRNWVSVASSADGNKLVAVVGGGRIYTSQATTSISGGQGSAAELMYAGNNQFILLSSNPGAASH